MSNVNIKYLKDENGNIISPVVSTKSIYNSDNTSLEYINKYSSDKVKIGNWFDGSPVYQQCFQYTLGSSLNTWKTIATITDVKGILKVFGYAIPPSSTNTFMTIPTAQLGGLGTAEFIAIYFDNNNSTLNERHNFEYVNNAQSYIVFEWIRKIVKYY